MLAFQVLAARIWYMISTIFVASENLHNQIKVVYIYAWNYDCQTSNISFTLVGNKSVDH